MAVPLATMAVEAPQIPPQIPIIEVGAIVGIALLFGFIAARLRQPSSLGYIFAGLLLGPLALKWLVPGIGFAPLFGEIGMIMLLFYLGLELSLRTFRAVGGLSAIIAATEMAVAFVAGFAIAKIFGLSDIEAAIVGGVLTATSTIVVVDFLLERKIFKEPEAHVASAILVLEDFFAILLVVVLTSLGTVRAIDVAVLNAILFIFAAFWAVRTITPRIIATLYGAGQGDKAALYAIAVGIFFAYLGQLLGLSPALGAYFAGFALADTPHGNAIKRELRYLREFFILFFFVAFGSSLFTHNGQVVLPSAEQAPWLIAFTASLLLAYLFSKVVAYGFMSTLLGITPRSALAIGALMLPLGEFSIIITSAAKPLLSAPTYLNLMTVVFLLILATKSIATPIFDRVDALVDICLRIYPARLRAVLLSASARAASLRDVLRERVLASAQARVLKSLAYNFVIAFAIIYFADLVKERLVWLPALPIAISIALLTLPLIIWPVHRFVSQLRLLAFLVSSAALSVAFPGIARAPLVAHQASDFFASILLFAFGVGSTLIVLGAAPGSVFVVLPVLYTLIAALYLSKSLYTLFERYGALESLVVGIERVAPREGLFALAREFDASSEALRDLEAARARTRDAIQAALLAGDIAKARSLLKAFKARERLTLQRLLGAVPRRAERRRKRRALR